MRRTGQGHAKLLKKIVLLEKECDELEARIRAAIAAATTDPPSHRVDKILKALL